MAGISGAYKAVAGVYLQLVLGTWSFFWVLGVMRAEIVRNQLM